MTVLMTDSINIYYMTVLHDSINIYSINSINI